MSTAQDPYDDDLMAIADAVGVTAPAAADRPVIHHPSVRHHFTDDKLAAVLANWSRAAAGDWADVDPDAPLPVAVLCDRCGDTGLVSTKSPTGATWSITCPKCGGQ